MNRFRIQTSIVAAALLFSVTGATTAAPTAASVTALSVLPGTGRAEVVIGVTGDVDVMDFALDAGKRVVVDIKGATLGIKGQVYDKVQRAGISNVRYSQFSKEVVRVVLELESARQYTVVKGEKDI